MRTAEGLACGCGRLRIADGPARGLPPATSTMPPNAHSTAANPRRAIMAQSTDTVTRRLLQEATLVEAWREGDNAANQPPGQGVLRREGRCRQTWLHPPTSGGGRL